MVAIEFHSLNSEPSPREPDVATLMSLIAVKPSQGLPLTVNKLTFFNRK